MTTSLRPISYVLLAVVGVNGASTPEMVEMTRRGAPFFWTSAESQVYAESKRLVELGYLRATKAPGKTRSRTFYVLTPQGRRVLRRWLRQPAPFPTIQHEASFRLISSGLISDSEILASLRPLRLEVERLEAVIAEYEATGEVSPSMQRYARLDISLARKLLQAHREWVDEVEAELGNEA